MCLGARAGRAVNAVKGNHGKSDTRSDIESKPHPCPKPSHHAAARAGLRLEVMLACLSDKP
jgi:hypothetical protein